MKSQILSGACALAVSACASSTTPLPDVTPQQAVTDPTIASAVPYRNPLEGFTYRAPTGPLDWRSVNEQQTEAE